MPATAGAVKVALPEVDPVRAKIPLLVPANPTVRVGAEKVSCVLVAEACVPAVPSTMPPFAKEAAEVTQVAQPTAPVALSVIGELADTAIVPVAAGRLTVTAPKVPVTGVKVMLPLVVFANAIDPTTDPAVPRVGVAVKAGPAPARTCPATPVIEIAPAALTATGAVPLRAPPLVVVAQVAQAIVPVVVIVPPVMGEVVAMEVTVPDPPLEAPRGCAM